MAESAFDEAKVSPNGRTLESEALFELRSHPTQLVSLTLGVVAYSVGHSAMAASAGLLAHAVSSGPGSEALDGTLAVWLWRGSLTTFAYVGLAAAVVKTGAGALLASSERRVAARVAGRLRVSVVGGLLQDGMSLPAPRVLAVMAVRLRDVEAAIVDGVFTGWRAAAQLLPLGACLMVLSSKLALMAALAVGPFALIIAALRKRARLANERARGLVERLEQGVDELVRNADLFRSYGAGARALGAIDETAASAGLAAARVEMGRALLSGANEAVAALAIVGVIAISHRVGMSLPRGALLPFAAVFFMAYRPLRDLGDARGWIARGNAALSALRRATAAPQRNEQVLPGEAPTSLVHRSESGQAPPKPTLELIDFGAIARGPTTTLKLELGEVVALVGPTGSGKTTLLRALLGLEPARGALLFNGRNMTRSSSGPSERPFAWVPQEAPLVTGTPRENVLLMGGTDSDAREALVLVGAASLAASEDVVGPGGRPLSGGERRQVSLARALVTRLPVLLLDEPTEGLDAASARAVEAAILRVRGVRTVLVATHRTEVLAVADRVVRLGAQREPKALAAE